jgi:hypothetical protein
MEQREETYRHRLYRPLQDEMKKKILFIMLNPSTATETETGPKSRTDKTIENIRNIIYKWKDYDEWKDYGGGFYVGNRYPHVSSVAKILKSRPYPDNIRKKNEETIRDMASKCDLVIYAWGTSGPEKNHEEPKWLAEIMKDNDIYCLGKTKEGCPRHPSPRGSSIKDISDTPILFRSKLT